MAASLPQSSSIVCLAVPGSDRVGKIGRIALAEIHAGSTRNNHLELRRMAAEIIMGDDGRSIGHSMDGRKAEFPRHDAQIGGCDVWTDQSFVIESAQPS